MSDTIKVFGKKASWVLKGKMIEGDQRCSFRDNKVVVPLDSKTE